MSFEQSLCRPDFNTTRPHQFDQIAHPPLFVRLVLRRDVGGPVVAVTAPLAKVEGSDCAFVDKPNEDQGSTQRELHTEMADRMENMQDVQRQRWAARKGHSGATSGGSSRTQCAA